MNVRLPFVSILFLLATLIVAESARAGEEVNLEVIHRIKDEAFNRSQVMDHLFHLTDLNGPRLTGSPGYRRAAEWSAGALEKMGLSDSGLEPWGREVRPWSYSHGSVRMKEPIITSIPAAPVAWSGGTAGVVEGEVMNAPFQPETSDPIRYDLKRLAARVEQYREEYAGRLRGKIVLLDEARDFDLPTSPAGRRLDSNDLGAVATAPEPRPVEPIRRPVMKLPVDPDERERFYEDVSPLLQNEYWQAELAIYDRLHAFFRDEGVVAVLSVDGRGDGGIIFADAYASWMPGAPIPPPGFVLGPESYNRLIRLVEREIPVVLEVALDATVGEKPVEGVNVIAEIPGGEKRREVVMLGGHLDSWHAGTGATDNASGCAVAMEVMRILTALRLDMDRTVRIGLWDGEEQAYYGSIGYVQRHLGDLETMRLQPDHARFSVYFNLDNGGGKIRGVYLQSNDMARPIFEAWFAPFQDLGVDTITIRKTSQTDHHVFDAIGLPGFQFIQDPLDYGSRTHHSDLDVYDHIEPGDLMQAAAVMASVVYHAATREELMPRKPLPPPLPPKENDQS